ncbi:MAG: hypothetical protein II938_02175 [Alphaproteobacteria bacterium]|nr:hypothetical protein [Alphaproteobacteria bacterium]
MRAPILKAVAMPPRILLAPFVPAMANLVVQIAWMFILIGALDVNPIVSIVTILSGHVFLVIAGTREPHLSHMMQAWGTNGPAISRNIYKSKGVKLAP